MSERGLRTPFLRVAKAGSTLGDREFTAAGGIGAGVADQVSDDKLVRLFADGATLVLQGLHRTWAPLAHFSQGLAADLGHPVQVNAYVTPPQNQGFADHYDVHDVFVLQTHGRKRWRLHRPVHDAPLRDQLWTDRNAAVEAAATQPADSRPCSSRATACTCRAGGCTPRPRWARSAPTSRSACTPGPGTTSPASCSTSRSPTAPDDDGAVLARPRRRRHLGHHLAPDVEAAGRPAAGARQVDAATSPNG